MIKTDDYTLSITLVINRLWNTNSPALVFSHKRICTSTFYLHNLTN